MGGRFNYIVHTNGRPTTACSRLATARFINYTLPTKLVLTGVYRAGPQAADAKALAASCFDMGAK